MQERAFEKCLAPAVYFLKDATPWEGWNFSPGGNTSPLLHTPVGSSSGSEGSREGKQLLRMAYTCTDLSPLYLSQLQLTHVFTFMHFTFTRIQEKKNSSIKNILQLYKNLKYHK